MKGIFKFMTVALAAGLVVSCSDDLGLDQAGKYAVGQQEGVGTIVAFDSDLATRLAAKDNGGVGRSATEGFVWKKGEEVRVFSLNQLAQDIFEVATGEGTSTATFKQLVNANLTGQKYAVTESQMIYGISAEPNADEEGNTLPLLTLTLPSGRDILNPDPNHTFDIVNAWTPGNVDDVKGNRNFPVPFWGAAEITGTIDGGFYEDAKLTTTVQSLTAAIRINLKSLPAGTKYIVLTTHGGQPFRDGVGYILADKISGDKDAYETWYKKGTEEPLKEEWIVSDGWSEPIAGTLRAVLNPKYTYVEGADKSEWPKLEIDPRLVHSDELIVDISKLAENDRIIYIPVVCGTYKNLHVIAAKNISEKWRYCYEGTELKNFQEQEFEVNKLYNLDMGLVVMEKAHIDELNAVIKNNCKDKDITTVINVGTFYAYNNYAYNSDTAIYVNVPGNVQLNLEKIVTIRRGKNFANPLTVTDLIKGAHSNRWSENRVREVEINVPNTWFKLEITNEADVYDRSGYAIPSVEAKLSSESPNYLKASKLNVVCGQSDVILGSVDGNKNSLVAVNVLASKTEFETAPEFLAAKVDGTTPIMPEEKAAIKIKYGFGRVNVVSTEDGKEQELPSGGSVPGTTGDIYIYTPALTEFETEVDTLDIEGRVGNYIRLDDALVYNMHFSKAEASALRSVATVGSSAIGYIYDGKWDTDLDEVGWNKEHFDNVPKGCWIPYTPIDDDVVNERGEWFKFGTGVGGVDIRSYWTGKALSVRAINAEAGEYSEITYDSPVTPVYPKRSYDVRTVWTAAQLASVGEGVYASSLKNSNHDFVDGDFSKEVAPKVAVYNIPVALVKTIWLGGWDYFPYRWIGARSRVNGFKLNGEGTELKNMSMLPYWYDGNETYIVDPHWCCTSCWRNPINPGKDINITQDVGLIRYIQNGDEVTVFNVNLNDPLLIMDPSDPSGRYCGINLTEGKTIDPFRIDNVGAIVGRISTKKANVYDNIVGEVKINMMIPTKDPVDGGRNIGGMFGYIEIGWTPAESDLHAYADIEGNWFNNKVLRGPLDMHGNQVWGDPNDPSGFVEGYEFVGGVAGKIETPTTADIIDNRVRMKMDNSREPINVWGFFGHVGGLGGYLHTTDATQINQNIVDCAQKIEADGGMYHGTYEGSYVGGLFGRTINTTAGTLDLLENLVKAQAIVAGKSFVGGLIGDLKWMKDIVTVDDSFSFYNANATVKSDKYMVDVADSIMCKYTCAGGLFGIVTLTDTDINTEFIKAAQVKTGLIKATGSWAGGLVGQIYSGDTKVGLEEWKTATRDRGVIVEVGKMASGRGVGGMFGTNTYNGQTQIRIFDGKGAWYGSQSRNYKTYSFIEVKEFERSSTPEQPQYYGTFSNVLGHMDDMLYINNDKTTEAELGTPSMFFVIDHLDSQMKKKVGYRNHSDQNHAADLAQKLWGDNNGYVGWRSNQNYYIGGFDSKHSVDFEQLESFNLPTANVFLQDEAYYSKDSKLVEWYAGKNLAALLGW